MPASRRPPNDQLPESIVLAQFAGMRNTVAAERLGLQDLERALNVDIDDAGQAHRRRGRVKVSVSSHHSLSQNTNPVLVVRDGVLGILNPDYSFVALLEGVGDAPVAYVQVAETIYFSSETMSGKVVDGAVQPWGAQVSAGVWVSPVVNPTETLNPIRGKLLGRPPLASALAHYNGRIYLMHGRWVWATELFNYDMVDKTRNFLPFGAEGTILAAVDDGVYVGTETAVHFLSGDRFPLKRAAVVASGAVRGSVVYVQGELATPQGGEQAASTAVMFLTDAGLHVGLNGGVCYNLTQTRFLFPEAAGAAALYRQQDGVNQYVGVLDSAGTPTSGARIGDYADAEIRRFGGAQ